MTNKLILNRIQPYINTILRLLSYLSILFDSIKREIILHILESYGIPHNIMQAIALTYKYINAKVVTPDRDTENFQITKGVLQDDTLAPFLFVRTLD